MVAQEQQSYRGSFLMYGIILLELPTLTLISVLYFTGKLGDDGWVAMLVVGTLIPLTFLLLMSITLETRLDTHAFSYRNLPFQRSWKKLAPFPYSKKMGFLIMEGLACDFMEKPKPIFSLLIMSLK